MKEIDSINKRKEIELNSKSEDNDHQVKRIKIDERTELHRAAFFLNTEWIQELLDKESNPNLVDKKGDTPLMIAFKSASDVSVFPNRSPIKNNSAIQLLASHTNLNISLYINEKNATHLHLLIKRIFNACNEPRIPNYDHIKSTLEMIELLVEKGADPNLKLRNSPSPIEFASSSCVKLSQEVRSRVIKALSSIQKQVETDARYMCL